MFTAAGYLVDAGERTEKFRRDTFSYSLAGILSKVLLLKQDATPKEIILLQESLKDLKYLELSCTEEYR